MDLWPLKALRVTNYVAYQSANIMGSLWCTRTHWHLHGQLLLQKYNAQKHAFCVTSIYAAWHIAIACMTTIDTHPMTFFEFSTVFCPIIWKCLV